MNSTDLDINREIRKVLVRHWIDMGKMSFRSCGGRVWMRGVLTRIAGTQETLTGAIVDNMFRDINRIQGIGMVSADLENWVMVMGRWQPLETVQTRAKVGATGTGVNANVQEIPDPQR